MKLSNGDKQQEIEAMADELGQKGCTEAYIRNAIDFYIWVLNAPEENVFIMLPERGSASVPKTG